jgi:hypothetical protein
MSAGSHAPAGAQSQLPSARVRREESAPIAGSLRSAATNGPSAVIHDEEGA